MLFLLLILLTLSELITTGRGIAGDAVASRYLLTKWFSTRGNNRQQSETLCGDPVCFLLFISLYDETGFVSTAGSTSDFSDSYNCCSRT